MRVVAGELRGRRIDGPLESSRGGVQTTRPTTDKVREAVFNALGSLGVIDAARVVDLFAGSGALGIEALSRGAAHCTFVENDRNALAVLRRNIESLGLAARTEIQTTDLDREAASGSMVRLRAHLAAADLVLADPPYKFDHWNRIFEAASSECPTCVLVAETEAGASIHTEPPSGWMCIRSRDYGRTTVGFFVTQENSDEGSKFSTL